METEGKTPNHRQESGNITNLYTRPIRSGDEAFKKELVKL